MAALAALEPTTAARERMVDRYLPLADSLARRYSHTSEPLDDLIQVARLGLLKAVDRWDPERGTAFSTFAVPTITGELRRYFRDRAWTIRPPRDLQELHLRVQRVRAAVTTELGREPSAGDVAAAIGCEVEDVVNALAAGDAFAPRSLDAPLQGDEEHATTGTDQLADPRHEIARAEDAIALSQLGKTLDARSWEVIRLRFEEDLTQREIGELVGCSQMHVSRIIRDALRRLREAADDAAH
ncbi:MAG TPA: SigB/SigF/SigG family RNA polymerase sigma factor [Solirubrobacteraceae bacterium]|nr:SigB/SigF/SigG family RNA polymerase sigma factor [Solirubrobacteraceae bacterium]